MTNQEKKSETAREEWTMITISLMTYDVTGTPPPPAPIRKLFEFVRINSDNLVLRWSNENEQPIEGTLGIVDWDEFLAQVREREPHRWTTDPRLPGPMGEGGLPNVMRQLKTTPAYQLFLAGIDVATFLGLCQVGVPEQPHFLPYYVIRHSGQLVGFIPTVVEGGRLFFASDEIVNGQDQALAELLTNGKLGRATLTVDDDVVGSKYYVPYAVVGGFTTPVAHATRRFWDAVRAEYHAQRT